MTDAADAKPDAPAGRDYRETLFLPKTDFPMRAGLPKQEPKHLERWERIGLYEKLREQSKGRERYVLHDGPPYANGHLHVGHALNKILKDFIVRTHQMAGFDAPYVPGWDCHGLPIEWKVEEAYRAKGKKKDDVPVDEFRKACRDYADKWIEIQKAEFKRLGVLGDWDDPYTTMAYSSEAAIVGEFLKFAETGQLFRGSKPVMWSPVERTALAEAEVEYKDHASHTIWVKFPVRVEAGDGPELQPVLGAVVVIWTTTPWTIPGNRAIAYNPAITYGLYEVTALEEGLEFQPWAAPGDKLIVADNLWESVATSSKIATWKRLADVDPAGLTCDHPFHGVEGAGGYWDYPVPMLAGDHVTDEDGTGFVHTAPGHGAEDYVVWRAAGYEDIPHTVDEDGAFYADVPLFAGKNVIRTEGKKAGQDGDANKAVIDALIAADRLLARGRLTHSYPHSWRSKAPVIFRNTPQWFIRLGDKADADSLRAKALSAIDDVTWRPAGSVNRIRAMVEGRPDWLISRQRAWGVPLTIFVHKETGDYIPGPGPGPNAEASEELRTRILKAVAERGADAWFTTPAETFLNGLVDNPADWEKVEDILDVWFDSGSTHAFTLEQREGQAWPASIYMEGSDQHRGWFQSSLLEACGTRGRAPYKEVLTHGFTLDEDGKKMSKSVGNQLSAKQVVDQYGADIVRLWTATSDYQNDQRIGDEILKTNADAYRRLRNTIRFLLGALGGFSQDERVERAAMPGLERWVLHRLADLDTAVREAYDVYDYKGAFAQLFTFCTNDLSAFYFDVRKDSLYCDRPDAPRRRACRTVMDEVFKHLTAWLAPILAFTMEEVWRTRFPGEDDSVHLRTFPEPPADWSDAEVNARWSKIRQLRRVVTGALEVERAEKRIGSSLEAAPRVYVGERAIIEALSEEAAATGEGVDAFLAEIAITSQATLVEGDPPEGAFAMDDVAGVGVVSARAEGRKCARSWKYFDPRSADPRFPDITARDADAVAAWDAAHGR